jgi:Phage major tail protein 2.
MAYRNGVDLILGQYTPGQTGGTGTFKALGYSTSCKISDSTETGERVTKETGAGTFKEKYVKSLSESITADGFVYDSVAASSIGFPDLKTLWLNKTPVTLRYGYRAQAGGIENENAYQGTFIITSLEQDGPADDDEKWSVTFENSGAITAVE